MFAFYCIYSGIAGLLNFGVTNDTFRVVLGAGLANIFNVGYILAGVGMYMGIGLRRGNFEGFGLITIATSVFIRMLAVGWVTIFHPTLIVPTATTKSLLPIMINLYAFSLAFIVACIVRFSYILNGEIIITLKDTLEVEQEQW